jgi:hypothetical protein
MLARERLAQLHECGGAEQRRHAERDCVVDEDGGGGLGDRLVVEDERANEASFDAPSPPGRGRLPPSWPIR